LTKVSASSYCRFPVGMKTLLKRILLALFGCWVLIAFLYGPLTWNGPCKVLFNPDDYKYAVRGVATEWHQNTRGDWIQYEKYLTGPTDADRRYHEKTCERTGERYGWVKWIDPDGFFLKLGKNR
jgi:hypothetical protein